MQSLIPHCVLGAVVLAGAATDWKTGRIPNWLTMPAMVLGLVVSAFSEVGFPAAVGGMLAALGVYFVFYVLWGRGAGDAKLMGAVGAFVGWPQVATVMFVVALLAGAAALAVSWRRGALAQVLRNTLIIVADLLTLRWRPERAASQASYRRMPHGPIIAAGTLVFLLFAPR